VVFRVQERPRCPRLLYCKESIPRRVQSPTNWDIDFRVNGQLELVRELGVLLITLWSLDYRPWKCFTFLRGFHPLPCHTCQVLLFRLPLLQLPIPCTFTMMRVWLLELLLILVLCFHLSVVML